MRVHVIQHVPFETCGQIEPILKRQGHQISTVHVYAGEALPKESETDWLIVMGGPMGVADEDQYAWLRQEKEWLAEMIEANKIILGICLGSQLIADVLGARVYPQSFREIGWFSVRKTSDAAHTWLDSILPEECMAFHWHGDTFDLPEGAVHIAQSAACKNQAFLYNNNVLGLQFHIETTEDTARALVKNCADELDGSEYVQDADEILSSASRFADIHALLEVMMDTMQQL